MERGAATDNVCMRVSGFTTVVICACSLLLAACSPSMNWRTVQLESAPLQIALPCKPQTQTRPVAMGAGSVQMSMVTCEVEGTTFAAMHFLLTDPTQAGEVLGYWQKAALKQLHGTGEQGAPEARRLKTDVLWIPKEALNLPQSQHIVFKGKNSQGRELVGEGLWFARMEGSSARLYHVVTYGNTDPKVTEMFFPSLKLQ